MSRRFRAIFLALTTVAVFAAGALPACAGAVCCPTPTEPVAHAQMPCCEGQTSIARSSALRLQTVTFAGFSFSPQLCDPVALVARTGASAPAGVQAARATVSAALHEPSPPLFLLNAQFLI